VAPPALFDRVGGLAARGSTNKKIEIPEFFASLPKEVK
jgi:hypothetical protein